MASVSALPDKVFWNNENWPSDLAPTPTGDKLLEGTVLFAQSQIIPSKHGIENDKQPHLTALRKTLVMLRPHNLNEDLANIEFIVRDVNGVIVSGDNPIQMEDPEDIPKQYGWIELGKVNDIDFPSLLNDPYVVQFQSNLEEIVGSSIKNEKLTEIFISKNKEIEVKTENGSWVEEIYLPSGSELPEGSKFQITCNSDWAVKIHYPVTRENSGEFRTKELSKSEKLVVVLVSDVWVAQGDPKPNFVPKFPSSLENPYTVQGQTNLDQIGNDFESVGLTSLLNDNDKTPTNEIEIKTENGSWMKYFYLPDGSTVPTNSKIQVTCESDWDIVVHYSDLRKGGWRARTLSKGETTIIILNPHNNMWLTADDLQHNDYVFGHNFHTATLNQDWVTPGMTLEFSASNGQKGVLQANVGGITELVITTLDAGFLTEPRNEFTFRDDPTSNAEYFETTMASRLVVVQYETMHFTEIMLPTGKFYDSISDDNGGVYSGDMREFIGKLLLSHGIDLANYGIPSSLAQSESPHKFTCAFLAAHNTVGVYQNGRVVHGFSGGNGMITLYESVRGEMSHEVGHNYDLGHFEGGFDGSVHRPANEINSSWGWDSRSNTFLPNFSPFDTGKDQCLDGQCQSPFLGKYQYGTDAMTYDGEPLWGLNRFTMYTPYVSKMIQEFLESKAVWDPSSSTGFRKYDPISRQMKEFTNNDNGRKVPRLYRVPVTTIVGYYDPDPVRSLESYIYPALHGAYGFVYDHDGGSTTGTSNGCELVVKTGENTYVFKLSTSIDPKGMNKFHVNVATTDEPDEALIYCQNKLLANRALEGPRTDKPPLKFTITGVPFDDNPVDDNPVDDNCEDKNLEKGKKKKGCDWVGKGTSNNIKNKCMRKSKKIRIWDWCPETCGKVGLGKCKDNFV